MQRLTLRSAVAMLGAMSVALGGFFVAVPAAITAPGDASLVVGLGELTSGRAGETYEYEVRVANNGAAASNVLVRFELPEGSHDVAIVNPDAACQAYRYVVNGDQRQDIPEGGPENCFREAPSIVASQPGDRDSASVSAVIKTIPTLGSYRFSVAAKMPYGTASTVPLRLIATPGGFQNNEGVQNDISTQQQIDNSPKYATTLKTTVTPVGTAPVAVGDPDTWDTGANELRFQATWENQGELTVRNLPLNGNYRIIPESSTQSVWENAPNLQYRTRAVCNVAASSPGVCDRIDLPTHWEKPGSGIGELSDPSPVLNGLAKGEKIVLDITGQINVACLPNDLGNYVVKASALPGRAGGEMSFEGSSLAASVKLFDVQPKACPIADLKVTSSLPGNGIQDSNNTVTLKTKYENVGTQDITGLRIEPALYPHNPNHYTNYGVDVTVRCTGSQPGLCPRDTLTGEFETISQADGILKSQLNAVNIPRGQYIELDIAAKYKVVSCVHHSSEPKDTPVPTEVDYKALKDIENQKVLTSSGTEVRVTQDSTVDLRHPFTGLKSCGPHDRRLKITSTLASDQWTKGWKQTRSYNVTVENVGGAPIDFKAPRLQVFLGIKGTSNPGLEIKYRIGYLRDNNHPNNTLDADTPVTTLTGESHGIFPDDYHLRLPALNAADPEANKLHYIVTVEYYSDVRHQCPISDIGTRGLYRSSYYPNQQFTPGYDSIEVDWAGVRYKKNVAYVVCNNVASTISEPKETVVPAGKISIDAEIKNTTGYATGPNYEIRFPAGSILFPKSAFGKKFNLDAAQSLSPTDNRQLISCTSAGRGSCSTSDALLTEETINGQKYFVFRGKINQLGYANQTGYGEPGVKLTINGNSGVIGNSREGYKASIISTQTGDISTPGNDPTIALAPGTYNLSNATWRLANDQVDYDVRNQVTIEGPRDGVIPELEFTGNLTCESTFTEPSSPVTVPAGQTHGTVAGAGKQWLKDTCTHTATAPNSPSGYVWKKPTANPAQPVYVRSYSQESAAHVAAQAGHTYTHAWTLTKAPTILRDADVAKISDPCGPGNAFWKEPADKTGFTWTHNAHDGSITVVAQAGYAFEGETPGEYVTSKTFPAPVDSNRACPNIKLKLAGERVEGSDHQFTLNWNQTNPAAPASTATVTSAIAPNTRTISAESGDVATVNNAEGHITLTTTPADALSSYNAKLQCYTIGEGGRRVPATVGEPTAGTNRTNWAVTIPDTNRRVICEATMTAGLGKVTLTSRDGGYEGTDLAQLAPSPVTGTQEWTIYPEAPTPGTPDLAKGTPATPGADDTFTFDRLKPGVYYIGRTTTPDGYDPAKILITPATGVEAVTAGAADQEKPYVKVTIQAGKPVQITTFSQRHTGALRFHKVSAQDTSLFLADSEWTLSSANGTVNGGPALTGAGAKLTDCVADQAVACTGLDKDHRAGQFNIPSLTWGDYTLTETKAPVGFRLPADAAKSKQFTVSATALEPSFVGGSAITNDQAGVPNIPHTGGLGRDHLIISGVFVLMIAGAATVWLMRRSQQQSPIRHSA